LHANIGLSPSVSLEPSRFDRELEVVRKLCIGLSRKGVLFKGFELERPGEANSSAEGMIEEADEARKSLPSGSPFDPMIEWLQDACQEFRDDLRRREADAYPFGEALLEFRSLDPWRGSPVAGLTCRAGRPDAPRGGTRRLTSPSAPNCGR
jgi:hypothetical protein